MTLIEEGWRHLGARKPFLRWPGGGRCSQAWSNGAAEEEDEEDEALGETSTCERPAGGPARRVLLSAKAEAAPRQPLKGRKRRQWKVDRLWTSGPEGDAGLRSTCR